MKRFIGLWMLMSLFSSFSVLASMGSVHTENQQWAQSLQPKVHDAVNPSALSDIPRFESATPKETQLNQKEGFQEAINKALATEDFAKDLNEISKKRTHFKLDPKTDPLFRVPENAEAKLDIDPGANTTVTEDSSEKTCEEGEDEVSYECIEDRYVMPQVPLKTVTLWVDHLKFVPNKKTRKVKVKQKKIHFHSKYKDEEYQDGYILTLPKDIKAFKADFCPKFKGIDAKTKKVFPMECSRIEGYQLNPASSVSSTDNSVSIHVSEASVNISLFHRTYEEGEEIDEWRSNCGPLEDMVEQGRCHYGKRVLIEGAGTRNIEGYAITKDEWRYSQIYDCQVIKDECASLKDQGCYPLSSRCKDMREDHCWMREQTYQCPKDGSLKQVKTPEASAFCLTGDCQSTDYKANAELLEAMSRLALLKEVQDELRANNDRTLPIFKGEAKYCRRDCLNFKDCCRRLKGWGVSVGVTDCNEDEAALAQRREQHQCHQVGTYCTHKAFGKCTSKKTSFCCFGNRLSRLIQEQGRAQLGIGWGASEAPDCRGLRVEEIARLDWSRLNFSEIFEDVMRKYKAPDIQGLQQKTQQKIQDNLHKITENLGPKVPAPHSGKLDADKNSL